MVVEERPEPGYLRLLRQIFEDVGHYRHCESPARFVAVLTDVMTSTTPARSSQERLRELLRAPS